MEEAGIGVLDPVHGRVSVEDEARLITYNPVVVLSSQAAFFGVAGLLYLFFSPVVPLVTMNIWLSFVLVLFGLVILFDVLFIVRPASDERLLKFWSVINKRQTVAFDLVAVGVIWLLLPYGGELHRLVIASFCIGYVPLQMIADPENAFGNRFSVVVVLGSFTAYLARQAIAGGGVAIWVLTGLVIIYGAALFVMGDVFRRVIVDALRNRRDLQLANAALGEALNEVSAERDARSRFIAAATHDLGQPLQAARLFAERAHQSSDAGIRDQALGKTVATIESAQAMLGQMLYHMRLEADAVQPMSKPVALRPLLGDIVARFQPQAIAAGARIFMRCPDYSFRSDAVLMDRAISNLLQNAIIHSGGNRILLVAVKELQYISIYICDNGIGIDPDDEADLFADYRQGKRSASTVRGGFGLGLASVRRLAGLMGGTAELIRRQRGAVFRLRLAYMQDSV